MNMCIKNIYGFLIYLEHTRCLQDSQLLVVLFTLYVSNKMFTKLTIQFTSKKNDYECIRLLRFIVFNNVRKILQ